MIEINPLETNKLFVGQKAYISLKEHGSVGFKSKATSSDESIISFVSSDFSYFRPLVHGKTGGDSGEKTYIFKANKVGTTTIKAQKIFRGNLKEELSIKIIVTAKKE